MRDVGCHDLGHDTLARALADVDAHIAVDLMGYESVEVKLQPDAPEIKRGDKLIVERDGKRYSVAVTDAQPLKDEQNPLIIIGQRIQGLMVWRGEER